MEREKQFPKYTIRSATVDDSEPIRRMQAQSWRDTYCNEELGITEEWLADETRSWLEPGALEKSREHLRGVLNDTTQFYRVALMGDEIVGLLHLETNNDGSKHLWGLYTAKETHGTGLAQQLMKLADEWAGGSAVDLGVVAYNERAKIFYRKQGFSEIPNSEDLFHDKIPTIRMIREATR